MKMLETKQFVILMFSVFLLPRLLVAGDGMMRTNVVIENARPKEVCRKFSRIFKENVSCEEKAVAPGSNNTTTITIVLTNATLEDALQRFLSIVPEYTWDRDKESGICHVYPATGTRLKGSKCQP